MNGWTERQMDNPTTKHEMISTVILLPSADSKRVVVSYKRKYVHKVLVYCLVKLAQEIACIGQMTVST